MSAGVAHALLQQAQEELYAQQLMILGKHGMMTAVVAHGLRNMDNLNIVMWCGHNSVTSVWTKVVRTALGTWLMSMSLCEAGARGSNR